MQFVTILAGLVAFTSAAAIEKRQGLLCSSGNPLCCQLDVLGVIDATCISPTGALTTPQEFQNYCAESGRTAECCTLSLTVAGLICTPPVA
ncbi:fungal hydrophobin-domain-containing protein [Macrophomina phaseolina]|uniref:Fungal hydrophobin-domain-containing protein n=1 Tax=Macrophomina phaseolina TaxID=35725 RepID=A0ABQ8GP28_9PEZI|nr:fungal hydrophobin-domain-containing protein [Macrophomina phaseolina]